MNNSSGFYQKKFKKITKSRIFLIVTIVLFASLLFFLNAKFQTEAEKIIKCKR